VRYLTILLLAVLGAQGALMAADVRPVQSKSVWRFDYDGGTFTALVTSTSGADLTAVAFSSSGGGGGGDIMPPTPTAGAIPVINEDADALTQVDFGYYEPSASVGRWMFGQSGIEQGGTHFSAGVTIETDDSGVNPTLSLGTSYMGTNYPRIVFDISTGIRFPSYGSYEGVDFSGMPAFNFGGFGTRLIETTDYADTALSVSGIDMNSDQTANIKAGMLVTITSAGNEYPYRVKSISSTVMRVLGPDINTAASTVSSVVWSAKTDAIGYMQFQVSGNWCDTTSTTLLADDMGVKFQWPLSAGRIIAVSAAERVTTGSPVCNVYVGGDAILDTGITVGTSWADSEGNLSVTHSAIDAGDAVEIGCTSGVATGNADLSLGIWYYLTGNE
jgi:hypothetical protein